jgi:hypothetical protein
MTSLGTSLSRRPRARLARFVLRQPFSLRPQERQTRFLAANICVAVLLILCVAPASADCEGPDPDYRIVARDAATIVIGEVVAIEHPQGGYSDVFTLRVDAVLRGNVPQVLHVTALTNHACSGAVFAALGSRIALAIHGSQPGFGTGISAVGVLAGGPYAGTDHIVTLAQAYESAGLAPPDTATEEFGRAGQPRGAGNAWLVLAGIGLLSVALALARLRSSVPSTTVVGSDSPGPMFVPPLTR